MKTVETPVACQWCAGTGVLGQDTCHGCFGTGTVFVLEDDDDMDSEELEADMNCHCFLDGGRYVCGAIGSEDCDECPNNDLLGKTPAEIEAEEGEVF